MKRQAVCDDLDRVIGLLPKGYRKAPAGNFEAGPRDAEGVRHIQGIYRVKPCNFTDQDWPDFPLNWL